MRLKEKVVLWMRRSARGLFFPFMSAYLFMSFHFSSIRTVCVVGGVRVRVRPFFCFFGDPPPKEDSINVGRIESML